MTTIYLSSVGWSYDKSTKTITVSERDVSFATTYKVISHRTGAEKVFEFDHSTGPEFDPNTKWIYKSADGLTLAVANDATMTAAAAEQYLEAKTRY